MTAPLKPATERFWRQYLDTAPDADTAQRWFYQAFRLGVTADDADDGALLVGRGIKTAASSLLWRYEARHQPLPQVRSLSILENGRDEPVCVVRTTELVTRPFREIDLRFAYDNGEWDRSLKTWRRQYWRIFAAQCEELGREPDHSMPVVCQRFRVLFSG
ncbi:MAG: ASCH domain-containing protein [Candidatus Latescibacteria bacterium]|jgi:uncharacterized protein YhfF|nr:ASCH domain-containing protein [Gemmatimonadaceae bacterium]MDP6015567.1 ASCH domain-containing protein [Candidatus Latescibacterota bacterium]MDP7449086.1 ASCH domain-containing protein [Candidatus Latescibacterota bacterium]HJP30609.1 ASCH domain-containing protein [Candidatus Latescibacterota bacterium]|tara:strand:+ start:366 stop:845 length:480 start_codon:yes stop_codon:yes gene_type:complete